MQRGATTLGEGYNRCEDCGGPKPKGRGYRVCGECKARRLEEQRLRRIATKSGKPCVKCKEPKEEGNKGRYCYPCKASYRICSVCGAQKAHSNHCANCLRAKCSACGGEKPAGMGRSLCDECAELNRWKSWKRNNLKRRKLKHICKDCKKLITDNGRSYCKDCRVKRRVKLCIECRERPLRKPHAKLCDVCKANSLLRRKQYEKEYKADKWKNDEEFRQRRLAKDKVNQKRRNRKNLREYYRMRYRINNENARPVSLEKYRKTHGYGRRAERVSTEPLVPYLKYKIPPESLLNADGKLDELAKSSGVDASFIRRIINGYYTSIRLDDADRLCIAMDMMLVDVYGTDISVGRSATLDLAFESC